VNRWLVLGLLLVAGAAAGIAMSSGGEGARQDGAGQDRARRGGGSPPRGPAGSAVNGNSGLETRAGRIVGLVRDVNGRPVGGAKVWLSGDRSHSRASAAGRFVLRARPGRRTVVAARAGYTQQSVTTIVRGARGARVDFALAVTAPDRIAAANSADRLIVWTSCDKLAALTEPALRGWIARGADGFVCQTRQLPGLGGTQRFTGDGREPRRGPDTRLQRALRSSPAVRRARAGKLLLYLGFYATNYHNPSTPFEDWFDDRAWSRTVLPRVRELAAGARSMGFAGLAIDQELYPQRGGARRASWSVRYPASGHGEAAVRAKVQERGRQLMQSMVGPYPGLELVAYDTPIPDNWSAKVQADINNLPDVFRDDVRIDLWDGLSSVQGYSAIRWMDAVFYKTFHLPGASWDTALEYNANRTYSYLSRRLSNWSYASSRLHVSPFGWVDEGPAPFEKAREPGEVAEQLDAFRRWGAGGTFADYAYQGLSGFDYGPYDDALRRASTPARVDRRPPDLRLTGPAGAPRLSAGETVSLKGVASDDFAIRAVRWYDDRGREGIARLTWSFAGDQRSGWNGKMEWSIDDLRIRPDAGHITISAEDIHGLARLLRLRVVR